ncbi:TetR/AcrR family transcriptional regulator [Frankia sp. AiPs1]|uniref:TetR/AcrR family transcriptional regulator n=1 Tax=Frankia sp. AiPs1 TaxID=573493 RepID=UPI0020440C70|nr:TetR/AcrR family transcriptional regulator [Frankia sp. AiPs1]MCM3921241.1 TetR/AcrR family transcriptional regulator [Frankia sp. AiPs1]
MGRDEGSAGTGRATTPTAGPPTAGARSAGPRGEPEGTARERILAAAEVLFAEHRFDRTSTARIAAAAGVPHGLIFYHFKTKMDLLLAVVQRDRVTTLGELDLPAPDLPAPERADPGRAIAELWRRLTVVLGRPSPVHRIVLQELAVHEEIRRRAMESTDAAATVIAGRLARIFGCDVPTPEQVAAAQLLTFAASMAPLLDQPDHTLVNPDALAVLLARGLSTPDA